MDFSAETLWPQYKSAALTGVTGLAVILPPGNVVLAVACPTGETVYISAEGPVLNTAKIYPIAYLSGSGTEGIPAMSRNGTLYLYDLNGGTETVYVGVTMPVGA